MDRESFETWVDQLTETNRLNSGQRNDILEQRELFESGVWRRQVAPPDGENESIAVGLIRGNAFSAPTVGSLMYLTAVARDGAMMYFEVVSRRAWESDY